VQVEHFPAQQQVQREQAQRQAQQQGPAAGPGPAVVPRPVYELRRAQLHPSDGGVHELLAALEAG
jgi:hypothetical protein